jgi:urea transport system permease protein
MSLMQPWLPLVLVALIGAPKAAGEPDPISVRICTDSLFASEANVTGAVECLVSVAATRVDTAFKPLFDALYNSAVRGANLPGLGRVAVIPGDEVTNDDYESFYPVRVAVPYTGEFIAGEDGEPLLIPYDSLVEPDVGRAERAILQPVLTTFGLYAPSANDRRTAARLLGESRDLSRIPFLLAVLESETNTNLRHSFKVSVARLQISSPDADVRLAAVALLRESKASEALPDLKALAADGSINDELRDAALAAVGTIESWNKFTDMLQNLFSGVSLGSILILMALGLAVIFGLMGVINMAHGEFMMIGAYATFVMQNLFLAYAPGASGWFLLFSFPAAFLIAAGIGMIIEGTVIRHLYGRPLETLLATWGVSLLLIQFARTLFGDLTSVSTPPFLAGGWEIFPQVVFPYNRLFIIVLTIVIVCAMLLLFYRTSVGMKVRAVTQNRPMSACLGVRTRRLDAFTFGLGTGIAGLAGCALTQIGNVSPSLGQNYIVDSFMVVVTGGVGKLAGTVVAGLGIGTLNKFLEPFFQAVYAKVILLALVILFLQWRPSGIFPAKGRHEDN